MAALSREAVIRVKSLSVGFELEPVLNRTAANVQFLLAPTRQEARCRETVPREVGSDFFKLGTNYFGPIVEGRFA